MTREELQKMIADTVSEQTKTIVNEAIKPLQETQEKYKGIFVPQKREEPVHVEKVDPGITLARIAKMIALAKNDPEKALFYAKGSKENSKKGIYPNDKNLHNALQGMANKALSTIVPADGGFLVDEQYSNDVIPLLLSKVVAMNMGARRVPLTNGNLNIPKLTGGATAYYQGESQNATASQQTLGNLRLSAKKLTVLVPMSNDLLRNASPAADMLVRDDMINQTKLKMDYTIMYGTGTDYTPMGIKTFVKKNYTANYSCTTAAWSADDMALMRGSLAYLNVPMISPGWMMNSKTEMELFNLKTTTNQYIYRDEMVQGKLLGYPYGVTNQINTANATAGTTYYDLFLGDFSELMIGEQMGFEIVASQEASYIDSTSTLVSAFSKDETVIKLTTLHDFGQRHDEAFLIYNRYHSS